MATPQLYKTTGIIISRKNSGEADRLLTVFCPHIGKKRFIGKGIRKIASKRSGHLELFSKTEFLLHRGSAYDYITAATVKHFYGSNYRQLSQLASVYTACEVIDRLIMEGQEHDETYALLDTFLTDIESIKPDNISSRLQAFINTTLVTLGYTRNDGVRGSLGNLITNVEQIAERKIRSVNLLTRCSISL